MSFIRVECAHFEEAGSEHVGCALPTAFVSLIGPLRVALADLLTIRLSNSAGGGLQNFLSENACVLKNILHQVDSILIHEEILPQGPLRSGMLSDPSSFLLWNPIRCSYKNELFPPKGVQRREWESPGFGVSQPGLKSIVE